MRLEGPGLRGVSGHQRRTEIFTGDGLQMFKMRLQALFERYGDRVFGKNLVRLLLQAHVS